jgi:hypothetical protein
MAWFAIDLPANTPERSASASLAHAARKHFGTRVLRISSGATLGPKVIQWRAAYAPYASGEPVPTEPTPDRMLTCRERATINQACPILFDIMHIRHSFGDDIPLHEVQNHVRECMECARPNARILDWH